MSEKQPGGVSEGRIVDDYCVQACDAECCKKLGFVITPNELMRGLLRVHYGADLERVKFLVHHRCPHLTEDNLCALWNEDPELDDRPDFCKNFLCDRARNKRIEFQAGERGDIEIHLG